MWDILQRVVSITTLFLLIIMIAVIFSNGKATVESDYLAIRIEEYKEDSNKMAANNLSYLEARLNRLAENQDSYQNGTATRLSILEARVKVLETENKDLKSQAKVVNNNTNLVNVNK